ncbi:LapA family protein [Enterococcus sp. JM9B]|uniref:LapA family protein n=1 Tax=Enterococcus sp. JM9B TaxID=1857216 RepID=UPI001374DC5D|nr:lipopolysaccharide assembly protein LapA domain-containing protein [Enterococcus sp. JM9B]KAF1301176.1 hypothetical protein BAU16_10585 [Enterococcus sp. JM9B]
MKNQWRAILGFVLVLIVVLFAVFNTMPVAINFGFGKIEAPLILVILGSTILGAIILFLTSTSTLWQQRKTIKELSKQLTDYQENFQEKVQAEVAKEKRIWQNQQMDATEAVPEKAIDEPEE